MKLSNLQTYCLEEMGIEQYIYYKKLNKYLIFYKTESEISLEKRNRDLLNNIIKALGWAEVDIGFNTGLIEANQDVTCCLSFGEDCGVDFKLNSGNPVLRLPGLNELNENNELKKEIWKKIKCYKV